MSYRKGAEEEAYLRGRGMDTWVFVCSLSKNMDMNDNDVRDLTVL